jgi:hypothetical protein
MVHISLGQHSVVLQLRLAQRGAVRSDDDQLGCTSQFASDSLIGKPKMGVRLHYELRTLAIAQGLQDLLVAQACLTGLHNQLQLRVDGLNCFFLQYNNQRHQFGSTTHLAMICSDIAPSSWRTCLQNNHRHHNQTKAPL